MKNSGLSKAPSFFAFGSQDCSPFLLEQVGQANPPSYQQEHCAHRTDHYHQNHRNDKALYGRHAQKPI